MEMVIFVGLPASGKSTFFRSHFAATHEHISKDLLGSKKQKDKIQTQLIEDAFQAQRSVVVDNTNVTVEDRAPLIRLGRMYGARIIGYYFESQVSQCLERNRQREGTAHIPDVAIYIKASKLVRPAYTEGFDELFYVQIADNATFKVNRQKDDGTNLS